MPPVGELVFDDPPGDVHIKYGYIRGGDVYVIKIASGFHDNPKRGLPSGDGLMLVFDQKTGVLQAILLDEGYLTNLRTAAAGAIAAKYLAPRQVTMAGILGAGVQGRMQLDWLRRVRRFDAAIVWGIDENELDALPAGHGRARPQDPYDPAGRGGRRGRQPHRDLHAFDRAAAPSRMDPSGDAHHRGRLRHGRKTGARRRRSWPAPTGSSSTA